MPEIERPDCFIDSNVWLYSFYVNRDDKKRAIAIKLIRDSQLALSTQTINEVCAVLLRQSSFPEESLVRLINSFYRRFNVFSPDHSAIVEASRLRQSYSLSYWDSLIVSTAIGAGVSTLYSEDMQNGLIVDGSLTIRNPFLPSA